MNAAERAQHLRDLEPEPEFSATARRLFIPTNPHAGVGEIPESEFEYANPVTLNNVVLLYGNAKIELADKSDRAHKQLDAAKLAKRQAERQLESYEFRLLRTHPAPKGVTTLKLIAAHLDQAAFLDGTLTQYEELREEVVKWDDEVHRVQGALKRLDDWGSAIDSAINSITVHLSYLKAEWQHGGRR